MAKEIWRASPRLTLGLLFATAASGVLPALVAWLGKRIIDAVESAQRADALSSTLLQAEENALFFLVIEACAMLGLLLATRTQHVTRHLVGLRVAERIRERIIGEATRLSLARMEEPETHDRIELARRQAATRPGLFMQHSLGTMRGAIVVVASALLLMQVSPWAIVVVLLANVPAFVAQVRFARRLHDLAAEQVVRRRELGYLENVLTREGFAKEVRVLGFAPALRARFVAMSDEIYRAEAHLAKREGLSTGAWLGLGTVAVYGAYLVTVQQAVAGEVSLGVMSMALVVFRQAQNATQTLLTDIAGVVHDRLYLADLLEVLPEATAEPSVDAAVVQRLSMPPRSEEAGLRFEGVTYRYPGTQDAALDDVSFQVGAGQVLGLVGHNGSGKSTLLKLALGLLEPDEGHVLLDGVDLQDWPPELLAERRAATFQDFARFKLTIDEGIGLGDTDKSVEQRHEAATRAGAHGFIEALDAGYETRLGRSFPGGVDLSGGQWQKLAIARAFLRTQASLVVLDEPTAALDPEAEQALFDEVESLRGRCVTLIAAHRLSALRDADEILLLEGGKITERGDHAALIAEDGRYAELFGMQAESYRELDA
ncbi:MAG: ABC transporter ATP-binding protein [Polyangiales bacterium]